MMLLFRFGAKRKILPLLFVPSVIHQYKPKIKKFWHLNKNARSFIQRSEKWNQTVIIGSKSSNWLACFNYSNRIIRSELIWSLYVISQNLRYSSCDNITVLNAVFPGLIPEITQCDLISQAVGPYFNILNIEDVKKNNSLFTIYYTETTNKKVKKQLDIKIRFWSETDSTVKVHHLKIFNGSCYSCVACWKIIICFEDNEIPLPRLQSLESDGPNFNKTVWNKLDEGISALAERKRTGLVNISTCNLRVRLNAFQKSLQVFCGDLSELVISSYIWFKLSAYRREDYEKVTLNHNGSLWLQLYCELLNSLMVLNKTSSLMSLQNRLKFCIIKHIKRSLIKLNVNIFWPKFTLLQQILIY